MISSCHSVANPIGNRQRTAKDISSTRLNTPLKVQSAREVSLRVKFIRLGEVRSTFSPSPLHLPSH